MLAAAPAEIDAALSDGGLLLPDPVPPVIKHLCVALDALPAVCPAAGGDGFARGGARRECDAARKMLAAIAAGELRLQKATAPAGSPKAFHAGRGSAGV